MKELISLSGNNLESLVTTLRSGSVREASKAADNLGELGDPQAIQPLISMLKWDDRDQWGLGISYSCALALAKYGEQAVEPLLSVLVNSKDKFARKEAAVALGFIKSPRAIDTLLASLKDNSFGVRLSVVEALGFYKDPRLIPSISEILNDEDKLVRKMAIDTINKIGGPDAKRILKEKGVIKWWQFWK